MNLDTLSFVFRDPDKGTGSGTSYCFDTLVSGKPLTEYFPEYRDFVTPFALGYKSLADQLGPMGEYLGESVPQSKWGVRFLICPECHDEGCGGIWGTVEVNEETVKWHNFSEGDHVFVFEKQSYLSAFDRLKLEITELHAAGKI